MPAPFSGFGNRFLAGARTCRGRGSGRWSFWTGGSTLTTSVFKQTHVPFVLVALLLVASSPLYFVRGIGIFDDSLYLKAGQLILDGLKPYRDFYDNKPPGIYYLSAAIAAGGGRGWLAPRIFLFLFAAIFQIAVIRWLQTHFGARVATFAAILLGLSYPLSQGYSLHTEPF